MTTAKRISSAIVLVSTLIVGCGTESGGKKEEVVLAIGGKTAVAYLPLTVAEQKGFLEEEGLVVEVQDLQGGAKALQALVAGSADVVIGYYDHTIQMQAKNKDITAIALLARYPGLVLAVRRDLSDRIHRVADLKGMNVGVTSPGSSSNFMINFLLSKEGLRLDDVAIIGIGVGSTAVASVEQKHVDALVSMDPAITVLQQRGLIRILADTRTESDSNQVFGGEYPGASLYTERGFLERRPVAAQRLVSAIVKALRWMHRSTPAEIAQALPDYYFSGDMNLYVEGLSASIDMFSSDGRFAETSPKRAFEVLSMFDDDVARSSIDLSKTYTNDLVNRAEDGRRPAQSK